MYVHTEHETNKMITKLGGLTLRPSVSSSDRHSLLLLLEDPQQSDRYILLHKKPV
jgi:hypothetical protein